MGVLPTPTVKHALFYGHQRPLSMLKLQRPGWMLGPAQASRSLAVLMGLGWGKFIRTKMEPGQSRAPGLVPARASGRKPPCWGLQELETEGCPR